MLVMIDLCGRGCEQRLSCTSPLVPGPRIFIYLRNCLGMISGNQWLCYCQAECPVACFTSCLMLFHVDFFCWFVVSWLLLTVWYQSCLSVTEKTSFSFLNKAYWVEMPLSSWRSPYWRFTAHLLSISGHALRCLHLLPSIQVLRAVFGHLPAQLAK